VALLAVLGVVAGGVWVAVALAASGPPTPTLSESPNTSPTNSGTEQFTFSSSGATSYLCSLNGSTATACTSPKTYGSPTALADGSYSFQVVAVDSKGKQSGAASYSWVVDRTQPMLISITRTGASPSRANPLQFTLTFSEPVSGVASGNFAAVKGAGVTGTPTVGTPTPNGGSAPQTTWTVPVVTTGVSGTGAANSTIGLNLTSPAGIKDAAGNTLSTASQTGATYVFDTAAPTVTSIVRVGASPTNASSVSWTVTFSESVTGVASGNFSLTAQSGLTGTPAVTGVSGSGTTWTVTASTGTGTPPDGSSVYLRLNLSNASGVSDLAGNGLANTLSGTSANQYLIDKFAPTPVFDSTPPDPNSVSTSNFTWHDGEAGVTYLCSTENGAFSSTVPSAGGPAQPCSSPLSYVVATTNNGQHQFAVEAVDALGNVSQAIFYSWKVDKGSIQNFTISGNASGLLYPGGPARPIPVTVNNPNSIPIYVTALSVSAPTNTANGCNHNDLAFVPASGAVDLSTATSSPNALVVPANGSVTLPAQGVSAPTIQLNDNHLNQTPACAGQTFTLTYTASAHS
jgi:hypothetical protein